ncbi:hypothetical protein Tco_0858332 [Tanacetum coccineum]|uniref:Uncharacterized protein n=1 Tax=Tanacetum coccineum TaxID=301880 RepID=A0ABQ5B8Y2_9ASTR
MSLYEVRMRETAACGVEETKKLYMDQVVDENLLPQAMIDEMMLLLFCLFFITNPRMRTLWNSLLLATGRTHVLSSRRSQLAAVAKDDSVSENASGPMSHQAKLTQEKSDLARCVRLERFKYTSEEGDSSCFRKGGFGGLKATKGNSSLYTLQGEKITSVVLLFRVQRSNSDLNIVVAYASWTYE